MVEIPEVMKEFETVLRLGKMLDEEHAEYDVTLRFALFTTTLCWIVQRMRTPKAEADWGARSARRLFEHLKKLPASSYPMNLVTGICGKGGTARRPRTVGEGGLFTDQVLIALRNCVAHGDGRKVLPHNNGDTLTGYKFRISIFDQNYELGDEDITDQRKKVWRGELWLESSDLHRIGSAIAQQYCDFLQEDFRNEVSIPGTYLKERVGAAA